MQAYEKLGVFYLGRPRDLASGETRAEPLLYDSRKLLTHALCMGMTGSGKTGLCLSLLEEAALDGIPTLAIDPKGDLGNLLLTFPALAPGDFAPWVDAGEAAQKGMTREALADQVASTWRTGLAAWDQDGARIARLREAVDLAIYTPGSNAGIPLSILRSLTAPLPSVREDPELLRAHIAGTVQGLLGLVGMAADPTQSREHILLATLLEHAFVKGEDLDLATLLARIQTPPFQKLGVLELEAFYPARERTALVLALNGLIASPSFASWLEGEPLDIQSLLYTPEGKPRIAIVSIAHLGDAERMFFVTLLLNQVLVWMRAQSGTSSLRALFYMDEVFGYFPPVAMPPSKRPMLTLLKQARAFGLGVVLATQNPVDLDYKGLSNIGTWFIGRLQTERDKARVLEGLEGAQAGAGIDRAQLEAQLASLGKRVFLLHDAAESRPFPFETRWSLSYLRGPMTRAEIKTLMDTRRSPVRPAAGPSEVRSVGPGARERPAVPPEIPQFFVPRVGADASPAVYVPRLLAIARIAYGDAKLGVDHVEDVALLVPIAEGAVPVDFHQAAPLTVPHGALVREPESGVAFAPAPALALAPKRFAAWSREFGAHLVASRPLALVRSAATGLTSRPGESERDFRARVQLAQRERRDAAVTALREKFAPKLAALDDKLRKAERAVAREESQVNQANLEGALSVGATLLGALFGNKPLSSRNVQNAGRAARSLGKAGKEREDVARASKLAAELRDRRLALAAELDAEIAALANAAVDEPLESIAVKAKKSGLSVQLIALAFEAVPATGTGTGAPC